MSFNERLFPENWREWTVIRELSQKTSGSVYLVKRSLEGREEFGVIKIIDIPGNDIKYVKEENHAYFQDIKDEFVKKVQVMSGLKNSTVNIAAIEDYLVEEKFGFGWRIYIRMEYLQDLPTYVKNHEMTEQDVIQLALGICNGLTCFHAQNICHQDIKPSNIFYSSKEECFKLGDFGIMGDASNDQKSYAAPEMWKGGPYTSSSDLYSLGLLLYQLMNRNHLPFEELSSEKETGPVEKRISGRGFNRPVEASDEFADIIMKTCSFVQELRYQSAAEMRNDLLEIQNLQRTMRFTQAENDVPQASDAATEKTTKNSGRGKWIVLIIIAAALLIGTGIVAGYWISDALTDSSGEESPETVTEEEKDTESELEIIVNSETDSSEAAAEADKQQYQATTTVHVRSEADPDSEDLGILSEGDIVSSTGEESGNWIQIYSSAEGSDPDATGWVSKNYLTEYSAAGDAQQTEGAGEDTSVPTDTAVSSSENTAIYEKYGDFIDQQISDFYDSTGMFTKNLSVGEEYKSILSWTDMICYSSDESVVTVSSGGKVTAVGSGTAYVVLIEGISAKNSERLGTNPMSNTFKYTVS